MLGQTSVGEAGKGVGLAIGEWEMVLAKLDEMLEVGEASWEGLTEDELGKYLLKRSPIGNVEK